MRIDVTPDRREGSKLVYDHPTRPTAILDPSEVERRIIAARGPGKLIDDGERVWFELADRVEPKH